MTPENFINEATVSRRVGISVAELRKLRKRLTEGRHWRHGEGNAVEWTASGTVALLEILTGKSPEKKEVAALMLTLPGFELFITRIVTNRRLVIAVRSAQEVGKSNAEFLRVQVRNSEKMRPGMVLDRCRHVSADLYAFEGRKARKPNTLGRTGPSQQTQK